MSKIERVCILAVVFLMSAIITVPGYALLCQLTGYTGAWVWLPCHATVFFFVLVAYSCAWVSGECSRHERLAYGERGSGVVFLLLALLLIAVLFVAAVKVGVLPGCGGDADCVTRCRETQQGNTMQPDLVEQCEVDCAAVEP